MTQWIALFRGINVGGNNALTMNDLCDQMTKLGFTNVRTYIASGNLLFETKEKNTDKLSQMIANSIQEHQGFSPEVLLITKERLARIIKQCPFDPGTEEARFLYVFFWSEIGAVKYMAPFESVARENEEFLLTDDAFYFFSRAGMGNSKLARNIEKIGKISATARNWNTIEKLKEMIG